MGMDYYIIIIVGLGFYCIGVSVSRGRDTGMPIMCNDFGGWDTSLNKKECRDDQ